METRLDYNQSGSDATLLATTIQNVVIDEGSMPVDRPSTAILARLFFATVWTVVFTGAVRKWLFPHITALYLLQDVPIAFTYLCAIYYMRFVKGYLFLGVVALSTLITLQCLAQIVFAGLDPIVAFIGLHNYLYYLPLLVIFPICLNAKYRRDLIRWCLILNIPMCLLAIAQNYSPRSSFINKTSEGDAFGVPGAEVARVSGTFNFVSFYALWISLSVALCVAEWLLPRERRAIKNSGVLLASTIAVNLCHLISASRGAILLAGTAILGVLIAGILLRSMRAVIAIGGICILIPVAIAFTYVLSPEEFNVVHERLTGQSGSNDIRQRVEEALFGFATLKFDLLGAGVGTGVDASHVGSSDSYQFTYVLAENDLIRTVMELGSPIGLIYALCRIFLPTCMILLSVRLVLLRCSPHVLPMSIVLFAQVYLGDLTRAATMDSSMVVIGYCFILGVYFFPDYADSTYQESIPLASPILSLESAIV